MKDPENQKEQEDEIDEIVQVDEKPKLKSKAGVYNIEVSWSGLQGNFSLRVYSPRADWTDTVTKEILVGISKPKNPIPRENEIV